MVKLALATVTLRTNDVATWRGFADNAIFKCYRLRWARQFEINTKADAMMRNRRGYGRR